MTLDPKAYVVGPDAEVSDIDLDEEEVVLPDGRRLTEELAERIAAEAVRAAREANLIPGGKTLSGGTGAHSPRVNVRLPVDLHREAVAVAERNRITVSRLIRRALQEYVDRHPS